MSEFVVPGLAELKYYANKSLKEFVDRFNDTVKNHKVSCVEIGGSSDLDGNSNTACKIYFDNGHAFEYNFSGNYPPEKEPSPTDSPKHNEDVSVTKVSE